MSRLSVLRARLRARLRELAADDRGYTTETVIWTATLAALAVTIGALIGPNIIAAAKDIVFQIQ